ncbi:ADP-ribosylation factor-like protein 16 [Amphibalanus amphitrite]|uniref:ADP-ribosylation factor-like protein 16 n=1 Tax=Amphibalanus amphitrite TaxID=1232801 RepID=UPI001C928F9E|nr:ADP-ribosylation factor-like protein 16 [Amphibalanus amphitrite]
MLVVVGPSGSGKTTLIQRLQSGQALTELHTTVPTVGSNISDLRIGTNKKSPVTVRELGGCMSPLWPVYYTADVSGVIYVIDASDVTQTACAAVLLVELLEHPQLQKAKC